MDKFYFIKQKAAFTGGFFYTLVFNKIIITIVKLVFQ